MCSWLSLIQSVILMIAVWFLVLAHREALGLVKEIHKLLWPVRSLAAKAVERPSIPKAEDGKSTSNDSEAAN